jgi:hypothetical protein
MMTAEPVEVVAFVDRQAQRAGEGREHLLRRLRPASLLEAGVVVGRHPGEVGDLLSAQTGNAASGARAEPDVFRTQVLAPVLEEVGELFTVHAFHHRAVGPAEGGTASPPTSGPLVPPVASAHRGADHLTDAPKGRQ